MAAHDLHHRAALVGLHGIPQLVDALQGGIAGGVEADGVGRAGDVVVDRPGDAHHSHAPAGELQQAPEGAVAADAHDALQAQQLTGGHGPILSGLGHELLAPGGVEHGAAPTAQPAHALEIQGHEVAVDEAVIAPPDTDTLDPHVQGRADHRPDGRVHAGGVSAAGEHADAPNCVRHNFHLFLSLGSLSLIYTFYPVPVWDRRWVIPSAPPASPPEHGGSAPGPAGYPPPGTPSPAPGSGRCSGRAPDGR